MTMYKDYKFIVKPLETTVESHVCQTIEVKSEKIDKKSISIYSVGGGGNYSIYLQDRYININVDCMTKVVYSLEGDIYCNSLKSDFISLPNSITPALLKLDTKDNLIPGTGCYINFNCENIIYDKKNKLLQIGNIKCVLHDL